MRIEIADDSFAHGTCSICASFSGAARMLGASPGTIVVIYFVDFSDKMYVELSDSDTDIRDFETK